MKAHSSKHILAIATITVLIVIAVPKLIGLGIERATIGNVLALIPPEAESQFEIRRNELNSGWLSSSAQVEVVYTPLGTDSISMLIDFDINHGPLLPTPEGWKFGTAYAAIKPNIRNELFDLAIADLPFPIPEVSMDLFVGFDQSLRLGMEIAALNYAGAEGIIDFAGLIANLSTTQDQAANFILHMGELNATESRTKTNIVVSGLSLQITTEQMNDISAASSAKLSIPSISSSAPVPFAISNIAIDHGLLASQESAGQVEIYQHINIGEVTSEIPFRSMNWTVEAKQLNSELVRQYYRLLADLQNEMNSNSSTATVRINELKQNLILLSLQNPIELISFIKANAFEGDHNSDIRITWAGLPDLNNIEDINTDIAATIAALTVVVNVSLDFEALQRSQFSGMVEPYVQQGYATIDNGRVLLQASLQNSVLWVNGDEHRLDQFF